jgi:uncharacterized surface protein with fasciclin (FAS1) repeats
MRVKKSLAAATAAAAALAGVALAAPAQASTGPSITDLAVTLSSFGTPAGTPDSRSFDFDIAVTALSNTTLKGGPASADNPTLAAVLDGSTDFTVVLPTDGAFIRSANELISALELSLPAVTTEAQAISFYVNTVGLETVRAVLLYHVVAGDKTYGQLRQMSPVTTVQGSEFTAKRFVVEDQLGRDAVVLLRNIPASNGKVNVINKVILFGLPG